MKRFHGSGNRIYKPLCAALCAIALSASGCAFLPAEPEMPAPPVLPSYESVQYGLFTVQRGDIEIWRDVRANLVSTQSEVLSFDIGGQLFSDFYVTVGDTVSEGELLARLDCTAQERELERLQESLDDLIVERQNAAALRNIDLQIAALASTEAETVRQYEAVLAELAGREAVLRTQLSDLARRMGERELRAGMDGIVTYLRVPAEGVRSIQGERICTIIDRSNMVFAVTGDNAQYFKEGDLLEMTVNREAYAVKVILLEDGATDGETIYLALEDTGAAIGDTGYGSLRLLIDERRDVLYVPSSAVQMAGGEHFVFILSDGVRERRAVTTGIGNGRVTEILSGLQAGEEIISGGL